MTELAPSPAPVRSHGDGSVRPTWRRAAPALLVYVGTRLVTLAVLALWAAVADRSWHQLLSARWDSLWYARIATDGYGYTVVVDEGARLHSDLAFFPLLPWAERLVAGVSPLGAADAGLLVSGIASLAAAWGIFAIGDLLHGRRTGLVLAVLWGVLPVSIVQSMAYSESLFTALAAWGLYAVLTGRWVAAGTLAALAGLTRPVGAAVVVAVWVTALVSLLPDGRWRRAWRDDPRMLVGLAIAPAGWWGYVAWVGFQRGSATGYLDVQGGWGNGFDGGAAFAVFVWDLLTGPTALAGAGLVVGVGLLLWLYVLCVRRRQPLPLLVYAGVVLMLALAAKGYFGSKPRLLIPAFPLLLPLAVTLARRRSLTVMLVLSLLGVASAVYGAFWLHGSGPP